MKVSRDLDKPRRYTLGPDTQPVHVRPGEDLIFNPKTRRYEVKNIVGGGRSAGVGGPTAAQMAPKPKPKPKPQPKKPMAVPFNPDSISTEKPEDRAKYERKFGLPPQGSPSKKRPAMKK